MTLTLSAQLTSRALHAIAFRGESIGEVLSLPAELVVRYLEAPEVTPFPVRLHLAVLLRDDADTEKQELGRLLASTTFEDIEADFAAAAQQWRGLDATEIEARYVARLTDSLHRHPRESPAEMLVRLRELGIDLHAMATMLAAIGGAE